MEEGKREGEKRGEKARNEGVFITKQTGTTQKCPLSAFGLAMGKLDHGLIGRFGTRGCTLRSSALSGCKGTN